MTHYELNTSVRMSILNWLLHLYILYSKEFLFSIFFLDRMTINFDKKKMYDKLQSESDSSDSDESEYCARSMIKEHWRQNFERGDFGDDFPPDLQEKVNEPKPKTAPTPAQLSKKLLSDILKKVRENQNAQTPTAPSAAQDAITTIIGTNAIAHPSTQQTVQSNGIANGVPNDIAQMTPTQSINPDRVSIFMGIFPNKNSLLNIAIIYSSRVHMYL